MDIAQLDDTTATRILTTIVRGRSGPETEDSIGLREALEAEFGSVPSDSTVSSGDLARSALLVLAEDRNTAAAIQTLAREHETALHQQTYDGGATIALGIAALFVLRTAMKIERDKQGRWSFKVDIKPASDSAVKKLIDKLVAYLPS